jgi:hypothetical protein
MRRADVIIYVGRSAELDGGVPRWRRRYPAAGKSDVHVHEQRHLPFLPVFSAAHDRCKLPMKTSKTAGV